VGSTALWMSNRYSLERAVADFMKNKPGEDADVGIYHPIHTQRVAGSRSSQPISSGVRYRGSAESTTGPFYRS
jgi:hypothetical protein